VKRLLFLFVALSWAWAQPQPSQPDAKLLELVNQGREEEHKVKADQVVVLRPASFEKVLVVGFLVGQNQALLGKVMVGDQLLSPGEACGLALRAKGWEAANGAQRSALAMQWLEEVQLAFGEKVLKSKPGGFMDRDGRFHAPELTPNLNGTLRVILWLEEPLVGPDYRRIRRNLYWFGKDGRLLKARVLETQDLVSQ
jgi:hypothetical protein